LFRAGILTGSVQVTGMAPAIKAELLECGKVSASLDAEVSNTFVSQ